MHRSLKPTCFYRLFLIYPLVSISSVQGFKCREIGGKMLLESDLSEECPWSNPSSPTFVWSVFASLLYPIGALSRRCMPEDTQREKQEGHRDTHTSALHV